jgi:hypothetical protein
MLYGGKVNRITNISRPDPTDTHGYDPTDTAIVRLYEVAVHFEMEFTRISIYEEHFSLGITGSTT